MDLDVTQIVLGLDNTPMKTDNRICVACRNPVDTGETLTVRLALIRALNFVGQNERLEFKEQMERYGLIKRIKKNDTVELTTIEAGKLQGLLPAIWRPWVTGQIGMLLEGPKDDG